MESESKPSSILLKVVLHKCKLLSDNLKYSCTNIEKMLSQQLDHAQKEFDEFKEFVQEHELEKIPEAYKVVESVNDIFSRYKPRITQMKADTGILDQKINKYAKVLDNAIKDVRKLRN